MSKKYIPVMLSAFIIFIFTTFSQSQDKPVEKTVAEDKKVAEEKKVADVAKEEKEKPVTEMKAGKSYFDGYVIYVNPHVRFKLSSTDNVLGDKTFYKVDKGEFLPYKDTFSVDKEGSHKIMYYSVDKMGNKESTQKVMSFTTDVTPPTVLVTTNEPVIKEKIYSSESLTFSITAKDGLSGIGAIEYSTDGKTYDTYSQPFTISTDKELELKVRVKDNVDNASEKFVFRAVDEKGKSAESSVTSIKIHVDKKAPVVTIKPDKSFVVKDGKNIASVQFKYSVNAKDEDSGVAELLVRIDGKGEFTPYKSDIGFSENGGHIIEAIAKDKVGNVSDPVTLSMFVDVLPPVSEIELVTGK